MGDDARHEHHMLVERTGKHKLSKEQEETINQLMKGLELDLEEEGESTLELPQLRK